MNPLDQNVYYFAFLANNTFAGYGYGTSIEAEKYCELRNANRDINCCEIVAICDHDEIAGRSDVFNLEDAIADIANQNKPIKKMKIKLHINKHGDIYYSKIDDNDEIIYSFSPDFEDIWTQDDHELYNQNDDLTESVEPAFYLVIDMIRDNPAKN